MKILLSYNRRLEEGDWHPLFKGELNGSVFDGLFFILTGEVFSDSVLHLSSGRIFQLRVEGVMDDVTEFDGYTFFGRVTGIQEVKEGNKTKRQIKVVKEIAT